MLPAKSLIINTCYRVTDFPDLCIILAFLGLLIVILILISKLEILRVVRLFAAILCFCPPCFCRSLSNGSFYTASEAANDQNQQNVATCCRCVASGKGQRNPCKIRLVAVLPIFRTSIYQSCASWALNRNPNPNLNLETENLALLAILRARWVWPFGRRFQLQHLAFSLQPLL
jgi:hypothetical protein